MITQYFAHPTAIVDQGASVGSGVKIWHFCHIMAGCTIGDNCNIGQSVFIESGVILGKNVKIQNNVSVFNGIICEDNVFLGPSMVFTDCISPQYPFVNRKGSNTTIVEKGSSIGANVTIVCGNKIGRYALVGAGTVITGDVTAHSLVVGNPSRQIGWVSEYGLKLKFDDRNIAICPETRQEYLLEKNLVQRIK